MSQAGFLIRRIAVLIITFIALYCLWLVTKILARTLGLILVAR